MMRHSGAICGQGFPVEDEDRAKLRRSAACVPALLAFVALAGCSHVYESKDMTVAGTDSQGIVYALPTTWLEMSAEIVGREAAKGGPYQQIEIVEKVLPDASHVYSLDHAASAFASDEIVIEVGADQLLDKVHTKTTDKTGDIIVSLVKAAASIATFSIPKPAPGFQMGGDDPCKAPPEGEWTYIFDPYTPETWPDWLNPGCLSMTPVATNAGVYGASKPAEDCSKGICHRAPVPTRVEFDFGGDRRREVLAGLLNKAPILSLDVDRTMFIEKKVDVDFDKGVIDKIAINRPSPALAAASLPLDVVKALLSAPAEIFKLKVSYSNEAANDAKAQKAMLENQEALLKHLVDQKAKSDEKTD